MSDWKAEVRWNRMQRAGDRTNPYRALRFYRTALILSGLLNLAMFLALSLITAHYAG